MAGDWFPVRTDLLSDPAVFSIAGMTGLSNFDVVGRLVAIWAWASHHTTDGVINVPPACLERIADHPGFADAMCQVQWLETEDQAIRFPKWNDWNSRSAKKRLMNSKRKATSRASDETDGGQKRDTSATDVPEPSRSAGEKSVVTEHITHLQNTPTTTVSIDPSVSGGGGGEVSQETKPDPVRSALQDAGIGSASVVNRLCADSAITAPIVKQVADQVRAGGGGPGAIVKALENPESRQTYLNTAERAGQPDRDKQARDAASAAYRAEMDSWKKNKAADMDRFRKRWETVRPEARDLVLAAAEITYTRTAPPSFPWRPVDPDADPATWPAFSRTAIRDVLDRRDQAKEPEP